MPFVINNNNLGKLDEKNIQSLKCITTNNTSKQRHSSRCYITTNFYFSIKRIH